MFIRSPSLTPTASSSLLPPESQSKACSRLRDRAGIPSYLDDWRHSTLPSSDDLEGEQRSSLEHTFPKPLKPWTPRSRTQAERAHMSHRERTIALDLLQDLPIPASEWMQATGEKEGLDEREFQSILSKKDLIRKRPTTRSEEEVRVEDLIKELTDEKIRTIDCIETDHALLDWVESYMFNSPTSTADPSLDEKSLANDRSPRLGSMFENHGITMMVDAYVEFSPDMDPEILLTQPLCLTPLSSALLLHLLRSFSQVFHNPHLALELFERIRRHPRPLVRYLGLTKGVFLEVMRIRWMYLQDLQGVQDHLVDMKVLGIELDNEIRALISQITEVVVMDEMNTGGMVGLNTSRGDGVSLSGQVSHLTTPGRRRFFDAERRAVSTMEAVVAQSIEDQRRMSGNRFRNAP
ncbi:hypothetical protein CROQUDRAFT_660796 [Cronartium quercuum f. sp. fusiforme G11]|uniref:Mtf2-like C-terminal domain-containing protein n=1 Tax=Cronartium quercuum f. sp. fusiforme G11 TaxID=708437 RepID=A0A9P6T9P8_9BASI|nr:hypothetical protein CROQUDRAFT_660796 [Cronartium quercuum f. sp. fusiforme G11]